MMRLSLLRLAAAPATAAAPAADPKMTALHKLLTGEVQFRNGAPLKVCNIEAKFGANWKAELESYAKKLPAEQKTVLERQMARVLLTRFTTRELSVYCGEGPELVEKVAQAANIAEAKEYAKQHGAEKLAAYVKAEAKNANWSDAEVSKFLAAVKAAK